MLGLVGVAGGGVGRVVSFDFGSTFEFAKNFVTASDELITFLESSQDLDVRRTGDSGGDGREVYFEFAVVGGDEIDALNELRLGRRLYGRAGGGFAVVGGEIFLSGDVALDEGLDGDDERVGLVCGGDFGGGREAGTQVGRCFVEGNYDFEVFGFFGASCALGGGEASGAEEGLVADFGDVAFEDAAGKCVDGDIRGLAHTDVDDVGFVDFDLGGDDGHIGEGHDGGAASVLDADDDGFTLADRDVGDEAVKGSTADGFVECVEVGTLAGDSLADVSAL